MATSKTGSFYLTDRLALSTANTNFSSTIDLGAYVDVGDQQALAIESIDFVVMRRDTTSGDLSYNIQSALSADGTISYQLTDLNPGTSFIDADDNSLVAGGAMLFDDSNNVASLGPDLYPDNFGKLDEARMVVNDQLYFGASADTTYAANKDLIAYVRIKCRIVKLSTKDWMAIAISSTQD